MPRTAGLLVDYRDNPLRLSYCRSSRFQVLRCNMQWIENIFHVDPDGGSGVLEAIILGVVALAVVLVIFTKTTLGKTLLKSVERVRRS
jgi:hypothetical protein